MNTSEVAIVGGGPCGLYAALLLARAGVQTVVFERKPELSRHPKAMGLSRRTGEILSQCGILEDIKRGCLDLDGRCLTLWSKTLVGEELGRVPLTDRVSPLTPCESLHCPQTWTERVLLEALLKEANAEVHFSTPMDHMENANGCVKLTLADASVLEAQWAIAADGAGSHIRKALDIATDGPGDLGHFINTMFRADYGPHLGDRAAVLYNTLGQYYFEAFVAVDGESTWLMHHFLQPGETAADFPQDKLAEIIAMASGLPEVPVEILGVSPWVMSPKVAKQWRVNRIFLVGDAAARLSPAGGLGLNTGLQGVHNLAWKLAAVIQGASPSLLDSYEAERRPCALHIMQNSNRNADEIFSVIAAGMRGDWDAARDLIAHSRRSGSGLGIDLGLTYPAGAFVADGTPPPRPSDPINDYTPSGRPGGRAPHLPVDDAGGRSSTLDFYGRTFVIMAGRAGGAWCESPMPCFQNGRDFECPHFEETHGITSAGAILVRPDGYVAARQFSGPSPEAPPMSEILRQLTGSV